MRTILLSAVAVVFVACPPMPMPTPEDAGESPSVAYDGETNGGTLPELPMNPEPLIDAGPIEIDGGCCDTRFRIVDREPADATGRLVSGLAVLSNVPLVRAAGAWSASACFPVSQSANYRYEFTWDAGVLDGGAIERDDGGVEYVEIPLTGFSTRASDSEPGFIDANGEPWNFYRAVDDGVGRRGVDGRVGHAGRERVHQPLQRVGDGVRAVGVGEDAEVDRHAAAARGA